ncbi:MAG: hypothetical protein CSA11_01005 [Chloroflexi bacterium]|nr:MAG: hypothetical protein CSA11_01005 [Chloroflexota bacterium]
MKRFKVLFFGGVFALLLLPISIMAEPNAEASDILIIEVNADPASGLGFEEPEDEFFEIYNNTDSPINLNGWTITAAIRNIECNELNLRYETKFNS